MMEKKIRQPFTPQEDAQLIQIVTEQPSLSWHEVAALLPNRTSRQCRERWMDYLRPDIISRPWTDAEDELILHEIERIGYKWTRISNSFENRSQRDVKNRWYSHLKCSVIQSPSSHLEFIRGADGKRIERQKWKRTPKQLRMEDAPKEHS
jgi:hypothetical protein